MQNNEKLNQEKDRLRQLATDADFRNKYKEDAYRRACQGNRPLKLIEEHRRLIDEIEKHLLAMGDMSFIWNMSEEEYIDFVMNKQSEFERLQSITDETARIRRFEELSRQITYMEFWRLYDASMQNVDTTFDMSHEHFSLMNESLAYSVKFLSKGHLDSNESIKFYELSHTIEKIEKRAKVNKIKGIVFGVALIVLGLAFVAAGAGVIAASVICHFYPVALLAGVFCGLAAMALGISCIVGGVESCIGRDRYGNVINTADLGHKLVSDLHKKNFNILMNPVLSTEKDKQPLHKTSGRFFSTATDTPSAKPALTRTKTPSTKKP